MRGFSLLELLIVVALIGFIVSMSFYFRWDDAKKELSEKQQMQEATTQLWLVRIEDPNQPVFWVWEDENGVMWMLSRSDNTVKRVGS